MKLRQGRGWLAALSMIALAAPLMAQIPEGMFLPKPVPAPAQPGAFPLYPEMPAGKMHESWGMFQGDYIARNVTQPTLTPYLPDPGKATGAAVIVAPGGAFMTLSMSHEGSKVAQKLAEHGVAAFVLKYRLNETPEDDAQFAAFAKDRMDKAIQTAASGRLVDVLEPRATADALTALRLVRDEAAKWHIDPHRVGMMGFSAGARTTLNTVFAAAPGKGPDFFGYIYGQMLPVKVPTDAPPMFVAIAIDDALYGSQGFGIVESWRSAKRPVELHAYEKSNHGFGLGWPGTTSVLMMDEFLLWMDSRGLLKKE